MAWRFSSKLPTGVPRAPWRVRIGSLSTRILLFVVGATVLTSLTVTGISVHSIDTFLREEIDRKFPALLGSTAEKLGLWYDQRGLEMGVFSQSSILVENLGQLQAKRSRREAARRELQQYLSYVLESFTQYRALFLLDPAGREVLWVGDAFETGEPLRERIAQVTRQSLGPIEQMPAGWIQIASAPVNDNGRLLGTLHALIRLEELDSLLNSPDLAFHGDVFLIGEGQRYLTPASDRQRGDAYGGEIPDPSDAPQVRDYANDAGVAVVGTARHLERFAWTLVVEELYDEAFAPVVSSIRRVLAINLAIVLALGIGAFRIAISIVRPIDALSRAAHRLSEGEEEVEIPERRGHDEVALLTRSFELMTQRLAKKADQLQASRREVEDANERLQQHNDALSQANETLEQLSITDGLTKLHNHRFYQDFLVKAAKRADRSGEPLSLILVDIDNFKQWNDRVGHAGGDEILRGVAQLMSELVRDSDLLARYGGEEFALVAINTGAEGALALAEKIRSEISRRSASLVPDGETEILSVSMGVATYQGDRAALFNEADRALYVAKDAGRDCVKSAEDL